MVSAVEWTEEDEAELERLYNQERETNRAALLGLRDLAARARELLAEAADLSGGAELRKAADEIEELRARLAARVCPTECIGRMDNAKEMP